MRKVLRVFTVFSLFLFIVILTSCTQSQYKDYAGRYQLTSLKSAFTTDENYEYYYFELKGDGSFIQRYKAGQVIEDTGTFEINGENIKFIYGDYTTKDPLEGIIRNGTISLRIGTGPTQLEGIWTNEALYSMHVGKYHLISITGIPGLTADSYDFNYIELKLNQTYIIRNQINGIITEQSGKWSVSGETIEFKYKQGSTTHADEYTIKDGRITIIISEGQSYVTLILEKE